jgi:hypothetical protein
MRGTRVDQPTEKWLLISNDVEQLLSSRGRELLDARVVLKTPDRCSSIQKQGRGLDSALCTATEAASVVDGLYEKLNEVSRKRADDAESQAVPRFLNRLANVAAGNNADLVRRLQIGANRALLADANRIADELDMQEVGKTTALPLTKIAQDTPVLEFQALPPGPIDPGNSSEKSRPGP